MPSDVNTADTRVFGIRLNGTASCTTFKLSFPDLFYDSQTAVRTTFTSKLTINL